MNRIVIRLDSQDCYALEGTDQEYPRRLQGDRLRYAIEEFLACDAESVAVARGESGGGRVLLLVAEVERVRQRMVEQISARYPADEVPDDLSVQAISPTIALALDELAQQRRLRGVSGLVWLHADGMADVVELVNSSMIRWRWCDGQADAIAKVLSEFEVFEKIEEGWRQGSDGSAEETRVLWIDESAGKEKPEDFRGVL
ncbi:MAG: hypothetical protein ACF788_04225, partial [Novipirellula sp. JB048]